VSIGAPIAIAVAVLALAAGGAYFLWRRRREQIEAERRREEAERRRQAAVESGDLLSTAGAAAKAVVETAARVREQGFGEALRGSIAELAGWAEQARPDPRRLAARDGTVTILFSDIEDSTAINHELGDREWLKVLEAHDRIVRARVDRHDGKIVKSQGDGFMITFEDPCEAVSCAVDIERALTNGGRRLRKTPLRVRIGAHVGQAVAKGGDLFGRNVAYAARVAAEADGGEILVSAAVRERVADEGFEFSEPRTVELKGLPGEHEVFAVIWEASG
jgi:adenylate cyclase